MPKQFNPESIRIIREARNISRDELAQMLGGSTSRQVIHAWETGKYPPGSDTLAHILNTLGLKSMDIFFTNTDQQSISREA